MKAWEHAVESLSACFYWVSDAIQGERRVEFGLVNFPRTCEQDVLDFHLKPSNRSIAAGPV